MTMPSRVLVFWPMLAVCLAASGCFQPVDPNAKAVASCTGSCPYGACSEGCAGGADASCTTPESCLTAYSCGKSPSQSCSAYRADTFQLGSEPTACGQIPGGYCVTTVGSYGVRGTFAVECTDAGQAVTDCSNLDPCSDGGSVLLTCSTWCGKRYCVR